MKRMRIYEKTHVNIIMYNIIAAIITYKGRKPVQLYPKYPGEPLRRR